MGALVTDFDRGMFSCLDFEFVTVVVLGTDLTDFAVVVVEVGIFRSICLTGLEIDCLEVVVLVG